MVDFVGGCKCFPVSYGPNIFCLIVSNYNSAAAVVVVVVVVVLLLLLLLLLMFLMLLLLLLPQLRSCEFAFISRVLPVSLPSLGG